MSINLIFWISLKTRKDFVFCATFIKFEFIGINTKINSKISLNKTGSEPLASDAINQICVKNSITVRFKPQNFED